MPRTLAIGDIHGCDVALESLLDAVVPTAEDTVVVLGDVVDRGPGSRQCIERLMALRDECHLVTVMGNHEEMMLNALRGERSRAWLSFGGLETLESYGGSIVDVPPEHVEFLRSMGEFHETDSQLFVHANWHVGVSRVRQQPDFLRWRHLDGSERPLPGGKRIVCGHTSQKSGDPLVFPGWVCIDTFAYGGGWLTCLDCESDTVIRANIAGNTEGPVDLEVVGSHR